MKKIKIEVKYIKEQKHKEYLIQLDVSVQFRKLVV